MDLLSIENNGKIVYNNYHSETRNLTDELKTMSVAELSSIAEKMNNFCTQNGQDNRKVPIFIEIDGKTYTFQSYSMGLGPNATIKCTLNSTYMNILKHVAPDSKPDNGEYWNPRGIGGGECSGFVSSKTAGERIKRMVNMVLENDSPKSHLDYREHEPNWIQFKFNETEFNLSDLIVMTQENNNIITLDILYQCKIIKNNANNIL